MELQTQSQMLTGLVERWGSNGIQSTSATLVNFNGVLYNVDGSSPDPKIDGESWKSLLVSYGIESPCYVTNTTPSGNSHPGFDVGGHMTPNPDGKVEMGADSYLMPLCSWHNNKARDGVAFKHSNTLMLKLSGFLEREVAVSFMARLPSKERFSIIYTDQHTLKTANLSNQEAEDAAACQLSDEVLGCHLSEFVLLERVYRGENSVYLVTQHTVSPT